MKKWPIALQVYSVRFDAEKDFEGTMKKIKEMGYDGVELAGTAGMTVAQVKEILNRVGLEMVSAHVMMDLIEDNESLLDAYAAAGIKYIGIPWMKAPENQEEVDAAIERIRKSAEKLKARGIICLYHNHDFEFTKIGGKYVLDSVYDEIPADLLQTELDVCWVNVGGEDPIAYLNKHAGRAPVVHMKDFTGEKSKHMYGLIGGEEDSASSTEESGTFDYRPVGYGKQDVPAIVEAAERAGAEWLVVEQDEPSMGRTAMECAQMSINYLRSFL